MERVEGVAVDALHANDRTAASPRPPPFWAGVDGTLDPRPFVTIAASVGDLERLRAAVDSAIETGTGGTSVCPISGHVLRIVRVG